MATQKTKEISKDMRAKVVERILGMIERDGLKWSQGFDGPSLRSVNALTPTKYRGINKLWLASRTMDRGLKDNRWATYGQAQAAGWQVRKGAKGEHVECWKRLPYTLNPDGSRHWLSKKELASVDPNDVGWALCIASTATVFNYSEIEGAPALAPDPGPKGFELGDRLVASSRCPVVEAAVTACCYDPFEDKIFMAPRGVFDSPEKWTAVLIHEMAHSTGVPLKRDVINLFGTPDYAMEELRAELACVFVSAELGVSLAATELESHTAYLQSWVKACREDSDAMISAIQDAQQIADYIMGNLQPDGQVQPAA